MRFVIPLAICAKVNKLGFVGGGRAKPMTSALSNCNHNDNQLPLKPVWPVMSTLFFCQKLIIFTKFTTLSMVLFPWSIIPLNNFYHVAYPWGAKILYGSRLPIDLLLLNILRGIFPKLNHHHRYSRVLYN